ncbi:MAG: hypothetical protein Q9218_004700 [Villophora microphyllina]
MDAKQRQSAGTYYEDEQAPGDLSPSIQNPTNFTDVAANDYWWTMIFSSSSAEQREHEDAKDYCNRISGMAENLTDVDKDSLDFVVFQRARAGLLEDIKKTLNAQIEQPRSLKKLGQLASKIQTQLALRTPTASASRGSVQPGASDHSEDRQSTPVQHRHVQQKPIQRSYPLPQKPVQQRPPQQLPVLQPSPQRSALPPPAPRTKQHLRGHSNAGRQDIPTAPSQPRGLKRKSIADYNAAELEAEARKRRNIEDASKAQNSIKIMGRAADRSRNKGYPDSKISAQERQYCKAQGLCYICRKPGHMHLECEDGPPLPE